MVKPENYLQYLNKLMFILLTFFHDCINPLPLKRDRIYDNMKKRRPLFFKDSTRSFRSSESLKKSGRGDHVLVRSFSSQVAAGIWLNIPRTTFREYLSSGKVWKNLYVFRKSVL